MNFRNVSYLVHHRLHIKLKVAGIGMVTILRILKLILFKTKNSIISGKGRSIWDDYTQNHPEFIKDQSNGNVAANSYDYYEKDVQALKDIEVITIQNAITQNQNNSKFQST